MITYICIQSQAYLHNIIWHMHLRHHQCIYVSYRMMLLSIVYIIYMNILVWYIYMNIHYCVYTYMWSQPYNINWFRTDNLMLNMVYQTDIPERIACYVLRIYTTFIRYRWMYSISDNINSTNHAKGLQGTIMCSSIVCIRCYRFIYI
jgi:hypothetical protein